MFGGENGLMEYNIECFPSSSEYDFFQSLDTNNEKHHFGLFNIENEWQQEYYSIYNSYSED